MADEFSWGTVDDTPTSIPPVQPEKPLEQRAAEAVKEPAPAAPVTPAPPVQPKPDETKPPVTIPPTGTPPVTEPPKTGEEKNKEGEKETDKKPEEGDKTPEQEPPINPQDVLATGMAFYEQAGKILEGQGLVADSELQLDWAAAGIEDPLSPEGLAYRDAERDKLTMQKLDDYMRSKNPRGYAYYLHSDARLPDEEFFKNTGPTLPEYELFKGNVDLHKQVLTDGYRSKGVPEAAITVILDQAAKDGTLFTMADAEYKAQQKSIADRLADLDNKVKADEATFTKNLTTVENSIDDIILKDKTPGLVIPADRKVEFTNYVKDLMGYNDETKEFMISHKLTDLSKLPNIIEALYFQYVGGNLTSLVRRQAATQLSRKLGQKVEAAKTAGQGSKESGSSEEFIPLSAIN